MKNFILGSIITLLFSVCVFFYIQNTSLSTSLKTYKNNKEFIDKDFQKAKEDYFIQQQSDNTSLILFTVTALFGLFTATTFFGVTSEFKSKVKAIDAKYKNQISEYQKSIIHINNLEGDLSFETAKNLSKDFEDSLFSVKEFNEEELCILFSQSLICIEYYSKSLLLKSDKHIKFEDSVVKIIKSLLERLVEIINEDRNVNKTFYLDISYTRFLRIKQNIENLNNQHLSKNIGFIFSKVSFKDLD